MSAPADASARVMILCGPARCGKTQRVLTHYRAALAAGPPGAALWLAPTWRAAAAIREQLLDGSLAGCFHPGATTFGKFAEEVLRASRRPMRPLTRWMKRELIRRLLREQSEGRRLRYFHSVANTRGLVDLVSEFISEWKRLEIWPEKFQEACARRGATDKDNDLFEIYAAYQHALREHELFDEEGRFWSARDLLREIVERGEGEVERDCLATPQAARFSARSPLPAPRLPRFLVVDGFTDFTRTQHEILALLARRAEATWITLPLEVERGREDLFAKPLKTLEELRRRHPGATVERLERPQRPDWPALDRLERTLFGNPRKKGEAELVGERGREDIPTQAPTLPPQQPTGEIPSVAEPQPNPADRSRRALKMRAKRARVSTQDSKSRNREIPPPSVAGLEILAAARPFGEIEFIGARIKRLLAEEGVRPGDVAVIFRSLGDAADGIDEVFTRLGIPFVVEQGPLLARAPALRAMTKLLKLDLEDWPFDELLAVLGSNYFQPDWPEWRAASPAMVERALRALQIPQGRARWLEQLAMLEAGDGVHPSVLGIARRLAAAFDALPQRATLPDWAKAWSQLAQETGLLRAMRDSRSADYRAWARWMQVLDSGEPLTRWLRENLPELDRRAAYDAMVDILGSERLGHAGDESGRVRVLSAASVRSLRVPYLFLAGLAEKAFPPPLREDRLYGEAEYTALIEAGLPLVGRAERTREEMLLFYEAATRATRRLYLSYPALDDAAQPLLPSPFLREVEEAFFPDLIPRRERTDLSPIPTDDEPLSAAEFRVKAVASALAGDPALLAGLLDAGASDRDRGMAEVAKATPDQGPVVREKEKGGMGKAEEQSSNLPISKAPNPQLPIPRLPSPDALLAGLNMVHLRQGREGCGPAEGGLQSEAVRASLAARFPPSHTFSATDLESYATCPFRYWMERILGIEPLEDLSLEFDVLERGRVAHKALALFHQRAKDRQGGRASPAALDPAEFDALLQSAIADALPAPSANSVQAALQEINRRLVIEWLSDYRSQTERYDAEWKDLSKPMTPDLFEASFGRAAENGTSPAKSQPLEFLHDGETVRLAGRIDRLDLGEVAGQTVFNVLDYKTGSGAGKITLETVHAGTTLQLPIYALAAMEIFLSDRDALPWRAAYWRLRDGGYKPRQALAMYRLEDGHIELCSEWEEIRDALAETIVRLVREIRGGRFPARCEDERCTGYCPYASVCRVNQARAMEKT